MQISLQPRLGFCRREFIETCIFREVSPKKVIGTAVKCKRRRSHFAKFLIENFFAKTLIKSFQLRNNEILARCLHELLPLPLRQIFTQWQLHYTTHYK